jgi:E3 SUMO-protein ligase PIAS1
VMVEADGEWHTNDNTYASEAWKKAHPPKVEAAVAQRRSPTPARSTPAVVYTLDDSDDEDEEGRVKRELSPSFRNGLANSSFSSIATLPPMSRMSHTPMPPSRQASKVIDLTSLDSDDEDISVAPTPPPLSVPKYTLSSPHTFQTASLTTPLPRMPSHSDHPLPPRPSLSAMNHLSAIERPEKRKAPDDYNGADLTWKRPRPSDGNSTPYTNGHGIPLSPLSSPSNGYAGTSYHRPLVRTSDPYTGAAYPSPASSSSTQATNGSRYPSYGYS